MSDAALSTTGLPYKATLIGALAVPLWAVLALFTTGAAGIPPFQLLALSFAVGACFNALLLMRRGLSAWRVLRQPARVWLLGVGGLFGYHWFYFIALSHAPAVQASLIAYLWPLLIVLFSALLPGERVRVSHILGVMLGLLGAALLLLGDGALDFQSGYWLGYLAAIACALTWSSYSVLNRLFGGVSSDAVTGFCAVTALLGALCHVALEQTVWPSNSQWLAILGLGLGPVGAAFWVWDYGTKHGNIQVLGTLAYATPLLSTLLLIAFGQGQASWPVVIACGLIVGGALVAAHGGRDT